MPCGLPDSLATNPLIQFGLGIAGISTKKLLKKKNAFLARYKVGYVQCMPRLHACFCRGAHRDNIDGVGALVAADADLQLFGG